MRGLSVAAEAQGGVAGLLPAARWAALLGGGGLPGAVGAALDAMAHVRPLPTGATVFVRGDRAHSLLALAEGAVALGLRDAAGELRTERLLRGPAWLDLSACWLAEPHAQEGRALAPVTLLELPREALFALADEHPVVWRRLGSALARELRGMAVSAHDLMHKNALARLVDWLLQHAEAGEGAQALVRLPVRKRDIASQLAVTPETLSRLMRSLSGRRLIEVAGYTVYLLDRAALAELARD